MLLVHRLPVVTNAAWLPGLVERLEVKDVNIPLENAADCRLVILLSITGAGLSRAII